MNYLKFIILAYLALNLCSCDTRTNNSSSTQSNEPNIQTQIPVKSEVVPIIVKSFTVSAEVFHFIPNVDTGGCFIKDANRKENVQIDEYSDGKMRLRGTDWDCGIIRYSKLDGYEYECHIPGGPLYAYNVEDII